MIVIFTYNRPDELSAMLDELQGKDEIHVIDDGSKYPQTDFVQRCNYHRTEHGGRGGFWRNWDLAFRFCKHSSHDRFVFMPDDWKEIQWEQIQAVFETLRPPFACNITNVGWRRSWTPVQKQPSETDGLYRVGWIDHGMITTRKTLELLQWEVQRVSRNHLRSNGSSGVGKQLSVRLHKLGVPMYTPVKSLARHQRVDSQMHPERAHELKPQ